MLKRTININLLLVVVKVQLECKNYFQACTALIKSICYLLIFFAEYSNDESFSSFNSVGFKSPSGSVGTILLAKSSDKYRIQSDCFTMLSVLVEQLTTRLKSGSPDCKIFINSSLPTPEILKYANEHFSAKQRVKLLQVKSRFYCHYLFRAN